MTGEHLSPDLREFVRLLAKHDVRYLVVGGEAVIHHGYPRLTVDVDFFWEREPENAQRRYAALSEFWGEPVPAVSEAEDLLEPGVILQYGRPPNRIDLINRLGTVDFNEAWRRRVVETLRDAGVEVPFPIIGLEDLLQSKRDAGRAKDLDDIEHLVGEGGESE
jgi:hypothetical protein